MKRRSCNPGLHWSLTIIDTGRASPGGAPSRPGNADRRQRTPDYRLGAHDQAVKARDRQLIAEFQPANPDQSCDQQQPDRQPEYECWFQYWSQSDAVRLRLSFRWMESECR